jgi:hypothetical protein
MARRLGDPGALTVAINARCFQSFRYDGLAERLSLAAGLLALPGKPVTVEAFAHLLLMGNSGGAADFEAQTGTPTRPRASPIATTSRRPPSRSASTARCGRRWTAT